MNTQLEFDLKFSCLNEAVKSLVMRESRFVRFNPRPVAFLLSHSFLSAAALQECGERGQFDYGVTHHANRRNIQFL